MRFGRAIKVARAAREMSQHDLAKAVGVEPSYISMLESGKRKNPSTDMMERIAKALGFPLPILVILGADESDLSQMSRSQMEILSMSLLEALVKPHIS